MFVRVRQGLSPVRLLTLRTYFACSPIMFVFAIYVRLLGR
jgi:hypothetical protein